MLVEQYSRLTPAHRRSGTLPSLVVFTVVAFAILGSMLFPNEMMMVLDALNGQTLLNNALESVKNVSLSIVQFSPFIFVYLSALTGTVVVLALVLPICLAAKNLRWNKPWFVPVVLLASCLSLLFLPIPTFIALWTALFIRQQRAVNRNVSQPSRSH